MNDTIKKPRSPSCPQVLLSKAIEMVRKLHAQVGSAPVSRVLAIAHLGFPSMHGGALSALSALKHYGLIDSEYGGDLRVTDLADRLVHPLQEPRQESEDRHKAALKPMVFSELYEGGYGDCDLPELTSHLVYSGFTPQAALKVARVFRGNLMFSNTLDLTPRPDPKETVSADYIEHLYGEPIMMPLKQYRLPLDAGNEVELRFFGREFGADQLDALSDLVGTIKKRFKRTPEPTGMRYNSVSDECQEEMQELFGGRQRNA